MSQDETGGDPRYILVSMLSLCRVWLPAVCVALGLSDAAAQVVPGRSALRPTFGRVVDAAGDPLADAVVTLVGGFPHLSPELQDVHVVNVAADRRGRVIPRLRADRCYVAWASGPIVDGKVSCSSVLGYFAAGAMFELVCENPAAVSTCRITGAEKWQHRGALRYFAVTPMPGTDVELKEGPDGVMQLPPQGVYRKGARTPFTWLEVRLSDGQPLWHSPLRSELHLPPPQLALVRAVDETGAPLAGARVQHRVGRVSSWRLDGLRSVGKERMRLLGTTDNDGKCTVEVPYETAPWRDGRANLLLFVGSAGRPPVAGGILGGSSYVSDHKVAEIKSDELLFECSKVEPLNGSMPEAPVGTVAHLSAVCKLHLRRNSYMHDARIFTAKVEADGSFAFLDVPAELHSCRLSFVPPSQSSWQPPLFAPESNRQLPSEVVREVGETQNPTELLAVELAVVDPTGGPARGAVAFVSSGDRTGILLRDSLLRVALDERGSARLRLVPGKWVAVVLTESGYCGELLDLGTTNDRVQISLEPLASMTVLLRDSRGKPVGGASVHSSGSTTRGTNDPVSSILQGLARNTRTRWSGLRTNDAGKVTIPFVPVDGVLERVELKWEGGHSEEFELHVGENSVVSEDDSGNKR